MRVCFVNPNTYTNNCRPNLGLLSLATVCKATGHSARILDANLLNLTPEAVAEEVDRYDVVALTAMTPTYGEACRIAHEVKFHYPGKPVILGGVHASSFPEECFSTGLFDYVVAGEGEGVIVGLLDDIQNKAGNPRIITAEPMDLNTIPLPDYSLIGITNYTPRYPHGDRIPWTTASTSRGCVYDCTFCVSSVSGKNYRAMSAGQVVALMQDLAVNHGVRDLTFYDDLFTARRFRVRDICERLIQADLDLTWTCESRVNTVTPELLTVMKLAGCRLIYYGIEAGNQTILDTLNKKTTLKQIRYAVDITKEAGIKPVGYFMLGSPGESRESMQDTINFAKSLNLHHAQFSVCVPLPGSKLYNQYAATHPIPGYAHFQYLRDGVEKPVFTDNGLTREDIENAVKEANNYFIARDKVIAK